MYSVYLALLVLVGPSSCASIRDHNTPTTTTITTDISTHFNSQPSDIITSPVPTTDGSSTHVTGDKPITNADPGPSRFPPRHYSFDPRPNINLDDFIMNYKVGGHVPEDIDSQQSTKENGNISSLDATLMLQSDGNVTSVDGIMTGRSAQRLVYSPLDLVAQFMPVPSSNNSEGVSQHEAFSGQDENDADKQDHNESSDMADQPRAIVDVGKQSSSGVSYIIHPDNLPPPKYEPLQDLPPPSHPVAKWRPDIFMKVCCSDDQEVKKTQPSIDVKSGYSQVGTTASVSSASPLNESQTLEDAISDLIRQSIANSTISSQVLGSENITEWESIYSSGTMPELEDTTNKTQAELSSNHTPRYEESPSSPFQEVSNFLKDIATSEGFKSAFLGDLIKNFGSLDQSALKLIYSLLIRPLQSEQSSSKQDRVGAAPDASQGGLNHLPEPPEDFVKLDKDRLPLRDLPQNGYQPFGLFTQSHGPSSNPNPNIRPSSPFRPPAVSHDEAWSPTRTQPRFPHNGRRGDENIDVITAPPFQTFEVVLGSSLNHDDPEASQNKWSSHPHTRLSQPHSKVPPQLSQPPQKSPVPFDKLTLGLEMPPQDALDALPPGSVLIPPSHILNRPNLPHVFTQKDGTPNIEMPLSSFLPNFPFSGGEKKPSRPRPPVQPQAQDLPPRLPSFLSSLLPTWPSRPPRRQNSAPILQLPLTPPRRPGSHRPMFPPRRQPTGPPPPVSKMTPPNIRLPSTFPVPGSPHTEQAASGNSNNVRVQVNPSGVPFAGPVPVPVFVSVPPKPVQTPATPVPVTLPTAMTEMRRPPQIQAKEPQLIHRQPSDSGEDDVPANHHEQNIVYLPDNHEDYQLESDAYDPDSVSISLENPQATSYDDSSPNYDLNYYDMEYQDYYDEQHGGNSSPSLEDYHQTGYDGGSEHEPYGPLEDYVGQVDVKDYSSSSLPPMDDISVYANPNDIYVGHQPETPTPVLTEQEKNDLQILLQNHRMANALAEGNGTIVSLNDDAEKMKSNEFVSPVEITTYAPNELEVQTTKDQKHYIKPLTELNGNNPFRPSLPPVVAAEPGPREYDTSVSHLWNNIQLIPLAPNMFDSPGSEEDPMNLTSLFEGAVPLSPDLTFEEVPDLGSDLDRISVDSSGGQIVTNEEILKAENAKFMAYILIGACCGLALLSIIGVIVIIRFRKTCGSRQIRTRTRLTEQESIENISRRVDNMTLGGEPGHKLGSWFTGRNEHIGSGKLRSNMTLPTVHNLKREKSSKSGSTRDLLSISSESSETGSPRQTHREVEGITRTDEEEPRNSWLHDEYRASMSDLSQAAGQDLAYIPRQYHNSHVQQASPQASTSKSHRHDHQQRQSFRYKSKSAAEPDDVEHSVRERRYTGRSRADSEHADCFDSHHGTRYLSSIDSEELEERLAEKEARYATDSELDDRTNYDEESREPSRYMSDSRELDDSIVPRRGNTASMTSQELGDHLSRDLKQYQSRNRGQSSEEARDALPHPESSQETEGEDGSRELRRSQSQVSFSRDNVQNEVFLEFDNIFKQHGQYLNSEPTTLGRLSRGTDDTNLSISRANTPDSIDLPEQYSQDHHQHPEAAQPPSPPTTPPRFSPPPPPPRPPKPGHLSQPGTPSPTAGRARPPSPRMSPSSPGRPQQRPVYWTSEEERLI